METTKTRLHPLLTAAAISLTVFSAVGIAALTGVLPNSRGSSEPVSVIAPEVQKPIEHAVAMPAPIAPVAPAAKPKARPRPVARHAAPVAPIAQAPQAAEAPPAYEAPKSAPLPAQLGVGGVIESVQEIEKKGENPIAGPVLGGIAGAVLGHQFGEGRGKTVATAVGAGAGILGGKVIEQKVRTTKHWQVTVRLDDGSTKTVSSESQPAWHAGERVRVVDGQILKS
ncbi:MAG TPA: glycine zipper 2TM domain-containing protein [Burkholderiales bacterium]|nr:glycine zipper 2TM domain-containing protein [Burkholderiales bacterium]